MEGQADPRVCGDQPLLRPLIRGGGEEGAWPSLESALLPPPPRTHTTDCVPHPTTTGEERQGVAGAKAGIVQGTNEGGGRTWGSGFKSRRRGNRHLEGTLGSEGSGKADVGNYFGGKMDRSG